jgi:hypothetical protein
MIQPFKTRFQTRKIYVKTSLNLRKTVFGQVLDGFGGISTSLTRTTETIDRIGTLKTSLNLLKT